MRTECQDAIFALPYIFEYYLLWYTSQLRMISVLRRENARATMRALSNFWGLRDKTRNSARFAHASVLVTNKSLRMKNKRKTEKEK